MTNKTSDKNVANVEDDVKYVKELLEIARVFFKAVKAETDYKNVDEIAFCNALENILAEREQMIVEKKKYTTRLTDEQYRKVIENAQMDTSNDTVVAHRFAVMQQQINEKDKRIQELEEENKKCRVGFNQQVEILNNTIKELNNSISKQVIRNKVEKIIRETTLTPIFKPRNEWQVWDYERLYKTQPLFELLEGEKNRNEYRKTN